MWLAPKAEQARSEFNQIERRFRRGAVIYRSFDVS